MEKEKTFFKIYQWVIVSFLLYIIIYVPAMMLLREYDFQFPCPYHSMTGQDCPLCGMTRDLWNIFSFSNKPSNPLTILVASSLIVEMLYRVVLFAIWKKSILWKHIGWFCIIDTGTHFLALLVFSVFCVASLQTTSRPNGADSTSIQVLAKMDCRFRV